VILRDYQAAAIDALRAKIREGHRRVLLVAPCGAGKTLCASEIIRSAVARGRSAIFIAPRIEIVDQTVEKLQAFGVSASVVMAGDKRKGTDPVSVCSVQTLIRRLHALPPADVVVVDECHRAAADSFKKVLAAYPAAVIVGLTATPWRSDRIGLAEFFDAHVVAATPAELRAQQHLVPFRAFAFDAPELHEVPVTAGEFNQKALELACNTRVLVGNVVREYLAHAPGRKALLFASGVKHSQALVAEFVAAGVTAEHLDCKTPREERRAVLARFRAGETLVVSSVGILVEGFDEPSAEVVILARPTKSLTLHLQILGRGMRPSPGKSEALILCHSGNLLRHGFDDDPRDYSPLATPARVRELHTCPLCCAVFAALRDGHCPACGEAIAPVAEVKLAKKAKKAAKPIPGTRIDMDEIRRRRAAAGLAPLPECLLARIGGANDRTKVGEFLRLRALGEEKGYKRMFAWFKFRATFGHWPKFTEEQLTAGEAALAPFLPVAVRGVG
jgi:DNA repair protein RadD